MTRWLSPTYFALGILLGFILCCVAGHVISTKTRLYHFKRMFYAITPQMQYYPTAHELLGTIRHEVRHDQILVLIGGSSIFRGVGQNPDELWSDELQRQLGDQYKVINYAVDSGNLTAFGGVIFRILRDEYPKIIFVSTCFPEVPGSMEGVETYSYLLWDAYYKGLIHPDQQEAKEIRALRNNQLLTAKGAEQQILSYLDSIFYFRNLWNWVGYRFAFFVWTDSSANTSLRARRRYIENIDPNLQKEIEMQIKDKEQFQASVKLFNAIFSNATDSSKKTPQIANEFLQRIRLGLEDSYSQTYRSKILCVIPSENPLHLSVLSPQLQKMHPLVIDAIQQLTENSGYNAITVGQDFSPADYADARHFAAAGGRKIASQVAKQVKNIALANAMLATS